MKEKLYKIIAAHTKETEFNDDSALELDLGMDSFQLMALILEIEQTFKIKIDMDSLLDILTVGDVCACVEKMLAAQKS